jgi:hypothetical protein
MQFNSEKEFANWLNSEGQKYVAYEGEKYLAIDDVVSDVYGVALYIDGDVPHHVIESMNAYYWPHMFAGEYWGCNILDVDGGRLVFINTDFTKSRHDDHLWYLTDTLWDFFANGSAPRKTNRKGPIGSKAIEGLGAIKFWFAFED